MTSRFLLPVSIVVACLTSGAAAAQPAPPAQDEPVAASAAAPPALLSDPGNAGDVFRIDVPQTWTHLPGQSEQLTADTREAPPVEGPRFHAQAQVWRGDGAGLVVTWIALEAPADAVEATARALLDHVRRAPEHASLEPGDAAVRAWNEDARAGLIDARMEWAHERNQTVTRSRAMVFQAVGGRLHLVRADCVTAAAAGAAEGAAGGAACEPVLDTLAIVPPAAARKPLGPLPPSAPAEQPELTGAADPAARAEDAPAPGAAADAPSTGPSIRAPALEPGGVLVMEPGQRATDRTPQWLYVLGGLLVAVAIYLTTRSRSSERRGENEEESEDGGGSDDDDGRSENDGSDDDGANGRGRDDEERP